MRVTIATVKVLPGAQRVLVAGCGDPVEVDLDRVRAYLPDGAATDDLNRLVAVERRYVAPLSAIVSGGGR